MRECLPSSHRAAASHDSPPQAALGDGGRVQLVQRHRQLGPELHLLHLDLLPASGRRQGGGVSGKRQPSVGYSTLSLTYCVDFIDKHWI